MNILERRLDLLRMEGKGFNRTAIVNILAKKHQCVERTIWYDFAKRGHWQPKLQALKEDQVIGKVLNRYEHIYQRASLYHHYRQGQSSDLDSFAKELESMTAKDKLLALKIMSEANSKYYEVALPNRARMKIEASLTHDEPFKLIMWRPELAKPKTT